MGRPVVDFQISKCTHDRASPFGSVAGWPRSCPTPGLVASGREPAQGTGSATPMVFWTCPQSAIPAVTDISSE